MTYGTRLTSLYILAMNPNDSDDSIGALLNSKMDIVFCLDNQEQTPIDYAGNYNVCGFVGIFEGLYNYRRER